jgi:MarR family transcriptional regulator, organic hydroperoxide resistance regulator
MTPSQLRIYHRLQLAAHRLQKSADRAVLEASGITTAQAAVLAIIAGEESPTQRSIAQQLGLNESAVTAMVARLVSMNLLQKSRDKVDHRTWNLRLTVQGRTALKQLDPPFQGINRRISSALGTEELLALSAALARLIEAFDET